MQIILTQSKRGWDSSFLLGAGHGNAAVAGVSRNPASRLLLMDLLIVVALLLPRRCR